MTRRARRNHTPAFIERLLRHALPVAANQVADILADILIGTILTYVSGNELPNYAAETDRECGGLRSGLTC